MQHADPARADRAADQGGRRRHGDAGRRAVQPVSPRARHRAAAARRGIQVGIGGFHVSGTISMLGGKDAYLDQAKAMGLSLFAGEAEGRLEMVLRDAFAERRSSRSTISWTTCRRSKARPFRFCRRTRWCAPPAASPASMPGAAVPTSARSAPSSTCRGRKSRRRSPDDVEKIVRANLAQGVAQLLHHRRQFRAQQGLGGDPRPADPAARSGEDADRHHHPGRHAVPQAPELHRERRRRRGQARLHRAGEHQSGEPDGRQEAAEQDHRIPQDAAGLEAGAC